MKNYNVEFTYISEGTISVEASSPEEAMAKVEKLLEQGMPTATKKLHYTDGFGNVDIVNETKDESNEG